MAHDKNTLSIYTMTLGRTLYLNNLLQSVIEAAKSYKHPLEHYVCFQGIKPHDSSRMLAEHHQADNLSIHFQEWPTNIGIASGMNRVIPQLRGSTIIKMDDDCMIQSRNFFDHVRAIADIKPLAVFSPFPVGLIESMGGVRGYRHSIEYSSATDTYYTFRAVKHVGGLCRVAPADLVSSWKLRPDLLPGQSGNEDVQHSELCLRYGIEMYYLENAIVVEHQESSLGQKARFAEYYKDRVAPPRGWWRRRLDSIRRVMRKTMARQG